jgi:6,7-dimethyl-8-ribityllumazine synthase
MEDAFVVIVKTEWNDPIISALEAGAVSVLQQHHVEYTSYTVPGAVEIPFAIKSYADGNLRRADAFIALGTVIRGDTPHFDYVCQSVTTGITQLNLLLQVPVIFGVLTVNTEAQAWERIGGVHGHKGEEAAVAAIKMIALKDQFKLK